MSPRPNAADRRAPVVDLALWREQREAVNEASRRVDRGILLAFGCVMAFCSGVVLLLIPGVLDSVIRWLVS